MKINKHPIKLYASAKAVITLFLHLPGSDRVVHVIQRLEKLNEKEVDENLENVLREFGDRHRNIREIFSTHFRKVQDQYGTNLLHFSANKQLLLGAFFTKEYSIQAAALFNPSIVAHPDQQGLNPGEKRFIMSLRATGEGHISSILFRTGTVGLHGEISLDIPSIYYRRLQKKSVPGPGHSANESIHAAEDMPDMNYELEDASGLSISERVIFPTAKGESMGMEDVRLVRFEDGGKVCFYGTYTAYDGKHIQTKLIETTDFANFKIRTLDGPAIQDKGMALFPEKLNGEYVMISRQGGENIHIMFSKDLYYWEKFQVLMEPKYNWELLQLGNCGSPIKTEKGWLLLTHGVGAMRKYVISAILLDLNNPKRIIGRMDQPLVVADESEREGYVPNVVYTCGFMLHEGLLIIPYAISDSATGFITITLDDLLKETVH
jgi:predicted GH43/DUF377 family glycosyl hydrolase